LSDELAKSPGEPAAPNEQSAEKAAGQSAAGAGAAPGLPPRGAVRLIQLLCGAAALGGAGVWAFLAVGAEADRAWRGLLVAVLYFTPLAAGMVTWPAIVALFHGRWTRGIERHAMNGLAIAPLTLLAMAILWIGLGHWAAWLRSALPGQEAWLNPRFVLARDMAGLALLWAAAWRHAGLRGRGGSELAAGTLAIVYAAVMTLLGFDLAMNLDPRWYSTLFGGYFLVGGLYAGLAAWTLASVLSRSASADQRHDLGQMLVATGLISAYLLYSQLLPIWFANLPREVRFVGPRLREQPWATASAAIVSAVYLGPLVLLLPRGAKRCPAWLGAMAAMVLVGMWLERWWLVAPTLGGPAVPGPAELSASAAFAGAAGGAMTLFPRPEPADRRPPEELEAGA
jgi:hypothetical protein